MILFVLFWSHLDVFTIPLILLNCPDATDWTDEYDHDGSMPIMMHFRYVSRFMEELKVVTVPDVLVSGAECGQLGDAIREVLIEEDEESRINGFGHRSVPYNGE